MATGAAGPAGTPGTGLRQGRCSLLISSDVGVLQQEVHQLRQDFSRVCEELSEESKEVDKLKLKQGEDLERYIRLERYLEEVTDLTRQQLQSKDEQIAQLYQELLNQAQQDTTPRGEGKDMEVEWPAGREQGEGEDAQAGQQQLHATVTAAAVDSSEQQQQQQQGLKIQAPNSRDPRLQRSQGQQHRHSATYALSTHGPYLQPTKEPVHTQNQHVQRAVGIPATYVLSAHGPYAQPKHEPISGWNSLDEAVPDLGYEGYILPGIHGATVFQGPNPGRQSPADTTPCLAHVGGVVPSTSLPGAAVVLGLKPGRQASVNDAASYLSVQGIVPGPPGTTVQWLPNDPSPCINMFTMPLEECLE